MKHELLRVPAAMAMALMVVACASHRPPEFGGRWRQVNRFADIPDEIPLHSPHVYQASPMDGTLKALLERWARDSGRELDYRLASDFTLHVAVSRIASSDVEQAVLELTAAYARQHISISVDGGRFIVQGADAVGPTIGMDRGRPPDGS